MSAIASVVELLLMTLVHKGPYEPGGHEPWAMHHVSYVSHISQVGMSYEPCAM